MKAWKKIARYFRNLWNAILGREPPAKPIDLELPPKMLAPLGRSAFGARRVQCMAAKIPRCENVATVRAGRLMTPMCKACAVEAELRLAEYHRSIGTIPRT